MTFLRTAAAAIALSLSCGLPAGAVTQVAPLPEHLQLSTSFTPEFGVGQYDGSLDVTVSRAGIVSGYYRPDFGNFIPVTGGVDGASIWLDIGFMGHTHVDGTLRDGAITGSTLLGDRVYDFSARPAAT